MHAVLKAVATTALAYVLYAVRRMQQRQRQRARLPPGPPPLPLIGNAHQFPHAQEWVTFREWGRKYGDLVTATVPGSTFIVINNRKVMADLLEARSANYSDRPHLVMALEIVGWLDSVVLGHYGETFRTHRRQMKSALGPAAVQGYHAVLERECVRFLDRLAGDPAGFEGHIRDAAGSIGLKIAYGENVRGHARLVALVKEVMQVFSIVSKPGIWIVDSFPFLRHLPMWFPFIEFKRYGEYGRRVTTDLLTQPYEDVKARMAAGTAGISFTSTILRDDDDLTPEKERVVQWAAMSILAGNTDTTTSLLCFFILAMVLHPEVQRKAQAEIDAVIGNERLPQIADMASLPYVEAVFKECLRWHPVIPLMARSPLQDDEYNGYTIPAQAIIIVNIWAANHDENDYKDPESFKPERFLPPYNEPDSACLSFGFGRRRCPGIHIAQAHVFLTIASILATFDVSTAVDAAGNAIVPEDYAVTGVVSHPKDFPCSIKPRSEAARQLVQRSLMHLDA